MAHRSYTVTGNENDLTALDTAFAYMNMLKSQGSSRAENPVARGLRRSVSRSLSTVSPRRSKIIAVYSGQSSMHSGMQPGIRARKAMAPMATGRGERSCTWDIPAITLRPSLKVIQSRSRS